MSDPDALARAVQQAVADMAAAAGIPLGLLREGAEAMAEEMARIRADDEALQRQVAERAEAMRPAWKAVLRLAASPGNVTPPS